MNPPLTFAQALVQLKLLTSQTANFTFSDDELTQALQEAWNNSYVCKTVLDNSLTFIPGTYSYTQPATISALMDVMYLPDSTGPMQPIARDLWQVINGTIYFTDNVQNWLNDNVPIYLKGKYKLLTTDSLTTTIVVNYVLSLAAYLLLKRLSYKMTFQFLRNDTSMGDIINARRDMQADMLTYKQALHRQFQGA